MPIQESQNVSIEKREAKSSTPLVEDIYPVEMFDVTMEKVETYDSKQGKTQGKEYENQFKVQMVYLGGKDQDGEDVRGRSVFVNYIPSFFYISKKGKNKLYQVIEAFWGRELSPEEEATFEAVKMNKLIGKQARVFIKNTKKEDKTYSNVDRFMVSTEQASPLTEDEKKDVFTLEKKKDDESVQGHAIGTLGGKVVVEQHEAFSPVKDDDIPTINVDEDSLPDVKIDEVEL